MREHTASLFPVEQREGSSLIVEEQRLNKEINRLRLRQFLLERQSRVLEPGALKLRNNQGLPQMALFTLENSTSRLTYMSAAGWLSLGPLSLPENYLDVYDDIAGKMAEVIANTLRKEKRKAMFLSLPALMFLVSTGKLVLGDSHSGVVWSSLLTGITCLFFIFFLQTVLRIVDGLSLCHSVTWSGLIPPTARRLIAEMKALGAPVFLLAEVEEWGTVIKRDPLILTTDGKQFYIVDSFETTGLEEHLKLEWSETAKA